MESSALHLGQRGMGYLVRLPINGGAKLKASGDDEVTAANEFDEWGAVRECGSEFDGAVFKEFGDDAVAGIRRVGHWTLGR